jgi:hypothetical protein
MNRLTAENVGHCAHMRVGYRTREEGVGHVVEAWWECSECKSRFALAELDAVRRESELRRLEHLETCKRVDVLTEENARLRAAHRELRDLVEDLTARLFRAIAALKAQPEPCHCKECRDGYLKTKADVLKELEG